MVEINYKRFTQELYQKVQALAVSQKALPG